jgi:endogenous inhibitor of DNA gyrase (YacG/DUF329 family)
MKPAGDKAPAPRQVICPQCKGAAIYAPSNPFRPFCSERCKNVDLGAWANEEFRMPDKGSLEDQLTDPGTLQ